MPDLLINSDNVLTLKSDDVGNSLTIVTRTWDKQVLSVREIKEIMGLK